MLRVRVGFSNWSGGPGLSTFYFLTPLEDAAAAIRVSECVRSAYGLHWKNVWPLGLSAGLDTSVDVITAADGTIIDTLTTPPVAGWPGAGTAEMAPTATAILMRLVTSTFIAGRRVRGRSFFCPVAAGTVASDGTPTAGAKGYVTAGGAALLADLDAGDTWCVWHRPKRPAGGTGPVGGGVAAPVTAVQVADEFSVLRSRRD